MSQAADRLDQFYNGDDYDPTNNPGGMGAGGHRENYIPSLRDYVTLSRETTAQAVLATAAASQQEAWGPSFTTASGSVAFATATTFVADGDVAATMPIGSHITADCGADGYRYGVVSGIAGTTVTVSLFAGVLTPNLRRVYNADTNTIYILDYLDVEAAKISARASQDAAALSEANALAAQIAAAASAAAAASQVFRSVRDALGKFPGLVSGLILPTLNVFHGDATSDVAPSPTVFTRSTLGTRVGPTGLVETVSAAGLRREWDAAGNFLGWLYEPEARTNAVLWCRDLTQAAWAKTGCTPLLNQTGADGTANAASSLTATTAAATCLQAITLASSARAQAVYLKRLTGAGPVYMTMDGGTTWTDITALLTTSWKRLGIPSQTVTNPTVGFKLAVSGDSIGVDYVQNEGGASSTSAIATTTAAVTRAADSWTIPTSAFGFNPTEGTFFLHADRLALVANGRLLTISDGTWNNLIAFAAGGASPGQTRFDVTVGGVAQAQLGFATDASPAWHRFIGAYKLNDFAADQDGAAILTDTAGTVPAVTTINIGGGPAGANPQCMHIKQITYWPRRLINSDCVTICS